MLWSTSNEEGAKAGVNPFDHGSKKHTDIMKTEALLQALGQVQVRRCVWRSSFETKKSLGRRSVSIHPATRAIAGIPRISGRSCGISTTPESTRVKASASSRCQTGRNWTFGNTSISRRFRSFRLYLAANRPVVERDGVLIMVDDDRMRLEDGEQPTEKLVRFRTLGCYPLTGAVESDATTLPEIIQEMLLAKTSERQGRVIDYDQSGSMEEKKKEGYF